LFQAKLSVELIYAPAGIYQFLLAGIKRVASGAYFYLDIFSCTSRFNNLAASASNSRLLIIGVYPFLHYPHLTSAKDTITFNPELQAFFL